MDALNGKQTAPLPSASAAEKSNLRTAVNEIAIDKEVIARYNQRRLGGDKYPGRTGIVIEENFHGRSDGGLWYVKLYATSRAKERLETFWSRDLILVTPGSIKPSEDA